MVDINYNLETLTGKHGGLLEVVEAIVLFVIAAETIVRVDDKEPCRAGRPAWSR